MLGKTGSFVEMLCFRTSSSAASSVFAVSSRSLFAIDCSRSPTTVRTILQHKTTAINIKGIANPINVDLIESATLATNVSHDRKFLALRTTNVTIGIMKRNKATERDVWLIDDNMPTHDLLRRLIKCGRHEGTPNASRTVSSEIAPITERPVDRIR